VGRGGWSPVVKQKNGAVIRPVDDNL